MSGLTEKMINEIDRKIDQLKKEGKNCLFIPTVEWSPVEKEEFHIGSKRYTVIRNFFFEPMIVCENSRFSKYSLKEIISYIKFSSGMPEFKRLRKGEKKASWNDVIKAELYKVKNHLYNAGYSFVQEQTGFVIKW